MVWVLGLVFGGAMMGVKIAGRIGKLMWEGIEHWV